MELRELTTFRLAAQTLSFTRTADLLGYAQSSVTAQIQGLEAEFGVPLFNRLGRRVTLTEAGERLLDYAEKMLNLAAEAHSAVANEDRVSGSLTITATESVCAYRLPAILHLFRAQWPQIHLTFKPLPSSDIYRALKDGLIDIAFLLEDRTVLPGLHGEILMEESLCLLAAPTHPLAAYKHISPEDLQAETMLLTERSCGYRNKFERMISTVNMRMAELEFGSVEAIKQCAIAGLGVAFLPQMTVLETLATGQLVALPWQPTHIYLQLVWHKDKWISPTMNSFIETCRIVCSQLELAQETLTE
jgi:DNA-binding transcriptional LysR family regulator